MACNRPGLTDYLTNFTGQDPMNAVICPFAQSGGDGLGLGVPLVTLFVFGIVGLGLTVRTQHPGPILVAGILTIGAVAATLPGPGAQIAGIVLLFAIVGLGFMLYRRGKTSL